MDRVIWQYWETRGEKPAFVDGLHALARRNSECEVVLVTPENLNRYLPDLPASVHRIREIAHKADMIRAMLVHRHGGMWLDSDAIVLRSLAPLFERLAEYDFVAFNDGGALEEARPWVRVNCFLSRPGSVVAGEWVRRQHAKFPRTSYGWEEIGTELLHPICRHHRALVKVLPFETICPVPWHKVAEFERRDADAGPIIDRCWLVMLSNAALKDSMPALRRRSCHDIAQGDYLLSAIMRHALQGEAVDGPAPPDGRWRLARERFSTLARRLRRQV